MFTKIKMFFIDLYLFISSMNALKKEINETM